MVGKSVLKFLPGLCCSQLLLFPSYTHVRKSDYGTFNLVNVYRATLSKITVPICNYSAVWVKCCSNLSTSDLRRYMEGVSKVPFSRLISPQLFCLFYLQGVRQLESSSGKVSRCDPTKLAQANGDRNAYMKLVPYNVYSMFEYQVYR